MKKSTSGFVLGAAVALAWHFRGRIFGETHKRPVTLATKDQRCGIQAAPAEVTLRKLHGDVVHWVIRNPPGTGCAGTRQVCIGNWRFEGETTTIPPVVNVRGLCRDVDSGVAPVTLVGHINLLAPRGQYDYDILIDGQVAADPIVRLVL